jgi:hypothetical protein
MLTIILALLAASPAPEQPKREVAERAADPADKMICKRFNRIGSLVGSERVCKPKRDWQRERDAARAPIAAGACGVAGNGGVC